MKLVNLFLLISLCFLQCQYTVRVKTEGATYCKTYQGRIPYKIFNEKDLSYYTHDTALLNRFSIRSIHVAYAYGFADDLLDIASGSLDKKSESRVSKKVRFMLLDIEATSSELSCYVDRFNELLFQLKNKEEKIIQDNTLYAIIAGAIFAMAGGINFVDPSINRTISVIGGFFVSYYSWRAYAPEIETYYKPKTTIIKDVWFNPEVSHNFSEPIWFLMRNKIDESKPPIREILIDRWQKSGYFGKTEEEKAEYLHLYFDHHEGNSSMILLIHRRDMITTIKSSILILLQDIRNLEREILYF